MALFQMTLLGHLHHPGHCCPQPSKSHISSQSSDAAFVLQKYPRPGTQASISTGHCPAPLEITTCPELLRCTLSIPTGSNRALLKNLFPAADAQCRQIRCSMWQEKHRSHFLFRTPYITCSSCKLCLCIQLHGNFLQTHCKKTCLPLWILQGHQLCLVWFSSFSKMTQITRIF